LTRGFKLSPLSSPLGEI